MRRTLLKWALGAACVVGVTGCESGPDPLLEGRKAVKAQNWDKAIQHFDEALKADPKNYHAMWGKADVYRRDNNLAKQAEVLEAISQNKDHMERYAGVVKPALETNYRKQSQALADTDPKKIEFLEKAIKLDKKSEANGALATLLSKRGDTALQKGDFKAAEADYKKAIKLRIARKLRNRLKGKASIAGFKAFIKDFQPRFDKVRKELEEAKIYDDKTKTFFVEAGAEIEGKPGDEGYEAGAEKSGLAAVTVALNDLTWKVAGKTRPEGASVDYSASVVTIVDKGFAPKKKKKDPTIYTFRISVPADAVFEKVQQVDKGEFKKPAPPPAAPASGASAGAASAGSAASAPSAAPASK
jgi:Tfp pilus assembly protein PilF